MKNMRSLTSSCKSVRPIPVLMAVAILTAAGCGSDIAAPTAPGPALLTAPVSAGVQAEGVDLAGNWTWSETVMTIFPPFVAEILGIEPEGAVTHATCHDSGTLSLHQTGESFEGTATQLSFCTTKGGQQIVSPFPPTLEISAGRISGRSIHFLLGGECAYQGTVSNSGGVPVRMDATGKCESIVHPGLLKTVSWQAIR